MDFKNLIKESGTVVVDGSMGAYLAGLGYKGFTPELAVIESPELVKRVHTEYIEAGAQVILTDTFGANKLRLGKKRIAERVNEINSKAAEIAADIRKNYPHVFIAGDIGPTGELLEPYGSLAAGEAEKAFIEQARILKEGGADFVLLETFQDLEELKIAVRSIRNMPDVFVLPSITLNAGAEYRTLMGQKIEDVVSFAADEEIPVMGINCGLGSGNMLKVVRRIRQLTDIPLWIKPNAGIPQVLGGSTVYPETPEEFAGNCAEIAGCGVKFLGGCCGTTPAHIALLKKKLNENN
ncbi:MAG: homocysteine S-methyltransferase family protein [Candidatus Omnitrophica bacterium]|nr:homocysteine S-methyltransferase family protein [Candidatus Omnitrophota bacterium]